MKLLMVCSYPMNPSEIRGGTSAAAYNLVQALIKYTDIEVTVFGFWPGNQDGTPVVSEHGRLKVIRYSPPGRFAHSLGFRSQRRLFGDTLRTERPDVVHAQGEGLYASLAVNSGCPNVYTIHGIRLKELHMERKDLGVLRYFVRTRMIKDHHSKARHIIAINEYTRREIGGLHSAKVRVIHNAVDEHYFGLCALDDAVPGNILLVGGARKRKDIITCLAAIKRACADGARIHLDIVGPNEEDYAAKVSVYVTEHGLNDFVTIHGLVSQEALDKLYKHADVLVLSSAEESSPIAIVEGMAAGKPVVATDVGGISEMVREGRNSFLVPVGDWSALGERLMTVICDRELRARFSKASHQIALQDWSAKAVAQQTYDMYREIANGK